MEIKRHGERQHNARSGAEMNKVDTCANKGWCWFSEKTPWTLTRFRKDDTPIATERFITLS
jgi:hypothetical protein